MGGFERGWRGSAFIRLRRRLNSSLNAGWMRASKRNFRERKIGFQRLESGPRMAAAFNPRRSAETDGQRVGTPSSAILCVPRSRNRLTTGRITEEDRQIMNPARRGLVRFGLHATQATGTLILQLAPLRPMPIRIPKDRAGSRCREAFPAISLEPGLQ